MFVLNTYEQRFIRSTDGAEIGGSQKLQQMQLSHPTIVASDHPILNLLLQKFATLCHQHITSISLATFDALYGSPYPTAATNWLSPGINRRKKDLHGDIGNVENDFMDLVLRLRAQDSNPQHVSDAPSVPLPDPVTWDPYVKSPFKDHEALKVLLEQAAMTAGWPIDGRLPPAEDAFKTCIS